MSTNGHGDDASDRCPRDADNESRRMKFKNAGKTTEEMRRRRVEDNVELRKVKREDTMMKRRNVDLDDLLSSPESPQRGSADQEFVNPVEEVAAAAEGLKSDSETGVFNNLQRLRKILSRETNPPIDLVLKAGLLPKFVELLQHKCEKMQFEAAWAITNIASGTSAHTQAVVDSGAVPILLNIFATATNFDLAEQALWGLGNIVGDGPNNRDGILNAGIGPLMLARLQKKDLPRSFVKNVAWMISNLTRGKNPPPNFEMVRPFLPALSYLLSYEDKDAVADTLWSLSYLTDGPDTQIDAVLEDPGIVKKVIKIMESTVDTRLLTPSVRVIGNCVTGTDVQTDVVVNAGAIAATAPILDMPKAALVKEACWLLSNIAAGNTQQIQALINADVVPKILMIMRHGEYRCQKEAAWIISNILAGGGPRQTKYLLDNDVMSPLCELLKVTDAKFITVVLDAISSCLTTAKKCGYLEAAITAVEECGGLDTLENLQNHDNEEIYAKAFAIIESFFSAGDGDEAAVDQETAGTNQQFAF